MSESHRAARCCCTNAIYSGSYAESDSDSDDVSNTRESAAEMQDVDAKISLMDSTKIESSVISRDPSRKSIAVEVLKNVDADRMSRISMQNLKLSLLFPEASLRSLIMSHTILSPFSYIIQKFIHDERRNFIFGQMFWGRTFESFEHLPTGSSFEIKFDAVEEEYTRSLHFPRFTRQKVITSFLISLYLPSIRYKITYKV